MSRATVMLILNLVDLAAVGLKAIPELKREYDWLRGKLQIFIDEDRDPTAEEWAELHSRADKAHQRIQEA